MSGFLFFDSFISFDRSNCNPQVMEVLRKHYSRPHFLPADSESSAIDWIFMGWPGRGASIHVSEPILSCVRLKSFSEYWGIDIHYIFVLFFFCNFLSFHFPLIFGVWMASYSSITFNDHPGRLKFQVEKRGDCFQLPSARMSVKALQSWLRKAILVGRSVIWLPIDDCCFFCFVFIRFFFHTYTRCCCCFRSLITVLIDTNQWYHDTSIDPGEISITIGSEYD